jgi:hypothetical protein
MYRYAKLISILNAFPGYHIASIYRCRSTFLKQNILKLIEVDFLNVFYDF